jgi:hypothetical protein
MILGLDWIPWVHVHMLDIYYVECLVGITNEMALINPISSLFRPFLRASAS